MLYDGDTRVMVPWKRAEDAKCPKGCGESTHSRLAICPYGFCNRGLGPRHVGHIGLRDKPPADCAALDPWCVGTCIEWLQDNPSIFTRTLPDGSDDGDRWLNAVDLAERIERDARPVSVRVGHVISAALAIRLAVSHIHGTLEWPSPHAWIGPRAT